MIISLCLDYFCIKNYFCVQSNCEMQRYQGAELYLRAFFFEKYDKKSIKLVQNSNKNKPSQTIFFHCLLLVAYSLLLFPFGVLLDARPLFHVDCFMMPVITWCLQHVARCLVALSFRYPLLMDFPFKTLHSILPPFPSISFILYMGMVARFRFPKQK